MTSNMWLQVGIAFVGMLSTVVIAVMGFLMSRTLNKIDTNQVELFERLHELEKDFYEVYGEHKSNHKKK